MNNTELIDNIAVDPLTGVLSVRICQTSTFAQDSPIRLSAGLEESEDLLEDIEQAVTQLKRKEQRPVKLTAKNLVLTRYFNHNKNHKKHE